MIFKVYAFRSERILNWAVKLTFHSGLILNKFHNKGKSINILYVHAAYDIVYKVWCNEICATDKFHHHTDVCNKTLICQFWSWGVNY